MTDKKTKTAWFECHRCETSTVQTSQWSTSYTDEHDPSQQRDQHVYQCGGCTGYSFVIEDYDHEMSYDDPDYQPRRIIFPKPSEQKLPDWYWKLPNPLPNLFQETYDAFSGGHYALATMGIRAIIDRLLTEKFGDVGGLDDKLKKAAKKDGDEQLLTKTQADMVRAIVEMGNASAHRGYKPNRHLIDSTLVITENIVLSVYFLPEMAKKIKAKTPPRTAKSKK